MYHISFGKCQKCLLSNSWYASHRIAEAFIFGSTHFLPVWLSSKFDAYKSNRIIWLNDLSKFMFFISCFCFRCETPPYRDKEKSEKSSWFLLLCQFYEVAGILYCSLLLKSFFFSLHVIWTLRVNKLLFFIHSLTSFAASVCSIWLGWRNVREPFVFFFLKKEQWILHGEYYCKNAVIN